jgi:ankyrin repeat protein
VRARLFAAALGGLCLAAAAPAFAAAPTLVELIQANDPAALKLVSRATANRAAVDGTPALLWAAHNGDAALVRALIAAGADVKATNAFGTTAIREASMVGSTETIRALLDAGADADSPSDQGMTNLMLVARTANLEAAKLLLDRGAKVNAVETEENQSALMWAAEHSQPEMVRLLLSRGADPNLHAKAHDYDVRVSAEPRVRYDPTGGQTALIYAARAGCVGCAKALVEGGAKIDDRDPDGVTALIVATLNAHFDVAAYLVKAGADVNRWDWWGRTPLWATVDYNTLPRGGRADRPTADETTSLEMIKILLAAGANPNARLKFEVPMRDISPDRGADQIQSTGMTPLLRAAKGGDAEAVDLLLKAGARVDLPVERQWRNPVGGMDPLMVASGLGFQGNDTRGRIRTQAQALATVKLLLAAGAKVNAQDDRGNTALTGAVYRGWNDVVKLLIENGADPYLNNADGKSPMDAAQGKVARTGLQSIVVNPETAALMARLKPPPAEAAPSVKPATKNKTTASASTPAAAVKR